jgi:PAS domain S-box-containing protein
MKTINVSASEVLNANILIVDEYDANSIPLKRLLNNAGYRNVSSTDDFHGLTHLHRKFHYDLILLNSEMPGIAEADLVHGLSQIENLVPVLIIVSHSIDALRALPAGTKDFIRKPFNMLEVKTRIHNMLSIRILDRKIEHYNSLMEDAVQKRTAELKESEARFRRLVELCSDWYWEQDRNGQFIRTSGPVREMLGLEDREVAGEDEACKHRWIESEREALESNIAAKRPFIDFPYRLIGEDGTHKYLRVSGEPIFDSTGRYTGYRGVGVDVSAHVEGGDRLSQFRKMSDGMGEAVLLIDNVDLRFLAVNDVAADLLGYTCKEFLELSFANVVGECHVHMCMDNFRFCGSHTEQRVNTVEIKHKNGTSFPAETLCRPSRRAGEKNLSVMFVHAL